MHSIAAMAGDSLTDVLGLRADGDGSEQVQLSHPEIMHIAGLVANFTLPEV